jgi:hypothetical protein
LTNLENNDDFLKKQACQMASRFRLAIVDQLYEVGADKLKVGENPADFLGDCRMHLEDMFFTALKIHALMRTASDHYEYVWNTHGTVTDRRFVYPIPDPGPQVFVLWSATPTVWVTDDENGSRTVCHKGRAHVRRPDTTN